MLFYIYFRCQDDHYIGPSVDVWALGILLYFMVTASMPFNASTVAALKTLILAGKFTVPSYISPACGSMNRFLSDLGQARNMMGYVCLCLS